MLKKPGGFDAAEIMEVGTFRAIPPGWYCAVILNAAEGETPNGSPYIEFAVDILDGEYKGYYKSDFVNQRPADGVKKWRGNVRYFTTEKAVGMLKGAIKAIEESNPGYAFDWDERSLKGKKVGLGIHREEYQAADCSIKTATKPYAFCAIQKVLSGEMPEPKDKPLNTNKGGSGGGQGYTSPDMTPPGYKTPGPSSGAYAATAETAPRYEKLGDDEELPF